MMHKIIIPEKRRGEGGGIYTNKSCRQQKISNRGDRNGDVLSKKKKIIKIKIRTIDKLLDMLNAKL